MAAVVRIAVVTDDCFEKSYLPSYYSEIAEHIIGPPPPYVRK